MSWETDNDGTSADTVTPIRRGRGRPRKNGSSEAPSSKVNAAPKTGAGWNLSDPVFDPEIFYTRATDSTGHFSVMVHVKFPPNIANHMATLIEKKLIPPFIGKADLIRHATVVYLHYLSEHSQDPEFVDRFREVLRDTTAAQKLANYQTSISSFNSIIENLDKAVKMAVKNRDYFRINTELGDFENMAEEWSEPQRSQLLAKIAECETWVKESMSAVVNG